MDGAAAAEICSFPYVLIQRAADSPFHSISQLKGWDDSDSVDFVVAVYRLEHKSIRHCLLNRRVMSDLMIMSVSGWSCPSITADCILFIADSKYSSNVRQITVCFCNTITFRACNKLLPSHLFLKILKSLSPLWKAWRDQDQSLPPNIVFNILYLTDQAFFASFMGCIQKRSFPLWIQRGFYTSYLYYIYMNESDPPDYNNMWNISLFIVYFGCHEAEKWEHQSFQQIPKNDAAVEMMTPACPEQRRK